MKNVELSQHTDGHHFYQANCLLWHEGENCGFINCFSQGHRGAPAGIPMRTRNSFAIGFLLEGNSIHIDENGQETKLSPGWMWQIIPGVPCGFRIDKKHTYRDWLINCDPRTAEILRSMHAFNEDSQPWHCSDKAWISRAYQRFFDDLLTGTIHDHADGILRLGQFLRQIRQPSGKRHHRGQLRFIRMAADRLRLQPHSNLTLEEILDDLPIPYEQMRKAFVDIYGVTPGAYRIRCRISRACELLKNGLSVNAIADELGYADSFQFSKQFKQHTGMAPSHYRRELL